MKRKLKRRALPVLRRVALEESLKAVYAFPLMERSACSMSRFVM